MTAHADRRANLRRTVHATLAIGALYRSTLTGDESSITVRWHSRGPRLIGDLQGQSYAETMVNADRIVFNLAELAELGIKLTKGDRVTLTDLDGEAFILDAEAPKDGPVTTTWEVVRPEE